MSEIPSFSDQKNRAFLKFLAKPGSPEMLGFSRKKLVFLILLKTACHILNVVFWDCSVPQRGMSSKFYCLA